MPHPSLELRNLSKLPPDLRKVAICIQGDSELHTATALDALSQIQDYVAAGDDNPVPPVSFLPIIYHLLRIPVTPLPHSSGRLSEADLKTCLPHHYQHLLVPRVRAISAMYMLNNLVVREPIPKKVITDLWQRLWPYLQFQNRYIAQLQDDMDDEIALCILHLSLMRRLAFPNDSKNPHPDISATPGVRCLIIRIWSRGSEELGGGADILGQLLRDFIPVKNGCPHLPELIDGAGGTIHDLASFAVKHIDGVARDATVAPPGITGRIQAVNFLLKLIITTSRKYLEDFAILGLAESLTKCIAMLRLFLISQRPHGTEETMTYGNAIYLVGMTSQVGVPYLLESLDTGLLEIIIECGRTTPNRDHPFYEPLGAIITHTLNGRLAVQSVLRRVQQTFKKKGSWDFTNFRKSDLWEVWDDFTKLAEERLSLKAKFKHEYHLTRFCDNIPCGKLFMNAEFRRCSRCRSRFYCSLSCQVEDWKAGNHKAFCKQHKLGRGEDHLSARDKTFLRYLMDHDYQKHKEKIFTFQLQFLKEHRADGTPKPFYTEFNYGKGEVKFGIHPVDHVVAFCNPMRRRRNGMIIASEWRATPIGSSSTSA
ncbi:hypothetical protein C8R43DRAFT_1228806 [Mycena crocata]|nr:hypothetical protein C8R43DRAFT_1228806 [Mycena crocata]